MPEGYLLMSASEREPSHVIRLTIEKSLGQRAAAERRGLSVRQFKRLVHGRKREGTGRGSGRLRDWAWVGSRTQAQSMRIFSVFINLP